MVTNPARELFLRKMRQLPAQQWHQADDIVRFLRERAQRKGLSSGGNVLLPEQAKPEQTADAEPRLKQKKH